MGWCVVGFGRVSRGVSLRLLASICVSEKRPKLHLNGFACHAAHVAATASTSGMHVNVFLMMTDIFDITDTWRPL